MTPAQITDTMMAKDYFSQWLGIERLEDGEGICRLQMTVRQEMCNGFGMAHGGITYSLADSALAFASNSRGRYALSFETSITHIKPVYSGEMLVAVATEQTRTNKLGVYEVKVYRNEDLVALFKGLVFFKDRV